MPAVETRAAIAAKEEVEAQFGKAMECQTFCTYQQPCFKVYSVNRGGFDDTSMCFHHGVYIDVEQAKVQAEGK